MFHAFWMGIPSCVSGTQCRRSGNGGPQTCLPVAHSVAKQQAVRPIFVYKAPKTLARRTMQDLLRSGVAK